MELVRDYLKLTSEELSCLKRYDTEGTLELYHWDVDRLNKGEFPMTPGLGQCRGVIVDTDSKYLICKTFGYTREIQLQDLDSLELTDEEIGNLSFQKTFDGTILRAFFYY